MAFERTKIVQDIFTPAEPLAIAVIDAQVALVGVANIGQDARICRKQACSQGRGLKRQRIPNI